MKQRLIDMLEGTGNPVYLQGSMSDEIYPESFFTYWNFDTPEGQFYDNDPHSAIWGFWVYFYSSDPATVERVSKDIISQLRSNGVIVQGRGSDISSDVDTHTGRMITCYIVDR